MDVEDEFVVRSKRIGTTLIEFAKKKPNTREEIDAGHRAGINFSKATSHSNNSYHFSHFKIRNQMQQCKSQNNSEIIMIIKGRKSHAKVIIL